MHYTLYSITIMYNIYYSILLLWGFCNPLCTCLCVLKIMPDIMTVTSVLTPEVP